MTALPDHWAELELQRCGTWIGGRTPSKANPAFWNGAIPWISPKAMKTRTIDGSDEGVTDVAMDRGELSIAPVGSILIVVRSGILKHSVPIAVTTVECAINQDIRALVPAEGIDARFLAAQLRHRRDEILRTARQVGVTVDSLKQADLGSLLIVLPPTDEQIAIANRLDAFTDALSVARRNIDDARARIADVPGALADRLKLRGEKDAGTVRVSELLRAPIRTGLSIAGSASPPGTKSLRLSALARPIIDQTEIRYLPLPVEQVKRHLLEKGDVVIARGSGTRAFVGRASYVDSILEDIIFPDTAYRLKLEPSRVDPAWIVTMWNSPSNRRLFSQGAKTTAGIWKISTKLITSAALPAVDIDRQRRDVEESTRDIRRLAKIETRISNASRLLDRAEEAIYQQALSGRLVPPSRQDAANLLEALLSQKPSPRKRPRRIVSTTADQELQRALKAWPAEGLTFMEVRERILAPYEDLKAAVFSRLSDGRMDQRFDPVGCAMRLYAATL